MEAYSALSARAASPAEASTSFSAAGGTELWASVLKGIDVDLPRTDAAVRGSVVVSTESAQSNSVFTATSMDQIFLLFAPVSDLFTACSPSAAVLLNAGQWRCGRKAPQDTPGVRAFGSGHWLLPGHGRFGERDAPADER